MSPANSIDLLGAGRYNITSVANQLPGCCCFCQTSKGPFIDTRRHFKLFGNAYICIDNCLREMASMANLIRVVESEPEPVTNLTRDEYEEAIREHVGPLLDAVGDLADYLRGASIIPLLSEADEDDGNVVGSSEGADSTPEQTVGSISSEGPDELSDDSGDGDVDDDDPFRE